MPSLPRSRHSRAHHRILAPAALARTGHTASMTWMYVPMDTKYCARTMGPIRFELIYKSKPIFRVVEGIENLSGLKLFTCSKRLHRTRRPARAVERP